MMNTNKKHLGNSAFQLLQRAIICCELRPGQQVSEADLASRYDLGKAPIRYALAQLSQAGLIRTMPRRGYVVAPISLRDVFELLDLRQIIEPATARLAAGKIDGNRLREIDAVYAVAAAAPGDVDEERMLQANREIHAAIAKATGNRWLEEITLRMLDSMERFLRFAWIERRRTGRQFAGHGPLIAAIESGDGAGASKLALEHVEEARSVILNGLLEGRAAGSDLLLER